MPHADVGAENAISKASAQEKVLSRGALIMIAIGNVTGGGIMAITGISIGMTGRAVVFAFALACVLNLFEAFPQFLWVEP